MSLNCREFADFLMDYLNGEVTEREKAVFDEHMSACPPCKHYLDSYRRTVELGRSAGCGDEAPPPPDAPEPLIRAILAARPKKPSDPDPDA
jgi:anti-sigma factor RsiW